MAKRLTDSDKWKKPWFAALSKQAKLVWFYLTDNCDHAGIWDTNYQLATFQLEIEVTEERLKTWFGDKIHFFDKNQKLWLKTFYEFQYEFAKDGFKAKQSAMKKLNDFGLLDLLKEQLPNSSEQLPNCLSISISKGISISKERGCGGKQNFDFESMYKKYPRKEGKSKGIKICQESILSLEDFESLSKAIDKYAELCQQKNVKPEYIKSFSGFMSCWRDYLDPDVGTTTIEDSLDALGKRLGVL